MITVRITFKENMIVSYEVSGHSGYAEAGEDIICAAVSSLTHPPVRSIEDYLKKKISYDAEDGYLSVEIFDPDNRTEAILRTMRVGLKEWQKQYPKYVCIEEIKVKETGR